MSDEKTGRDGLSFPRSLRLLNAKQFQAVFRGAQINLPAGALRIRVRMNTLSHPRIGLVVSKKGNPRAHTRNRIKRVMRERFRHLAGEIASADYVVQVFAPVDDENFAERFDRQLQRASSKIEKVHGI